MIIFILLNNLEMGLKSQTFATIFGLYALSGATSCSGNDIKNSNNENSKSDSTEVLQFPEIMETDSTYFFPGVTEDTQKQISLCLQPDSPDAFTSTKVLESVKDPKTTTLEFSLSQLFQKYGNRSHPLAVRGVKKDFRALLGKDGIENLSDSIPQKLSLRAEEITSDTQYEAGDTLRFSLINPLLQGAFPQYLSDQLKEDGFQTFSDTESSLIAKKMERKNLNRNSETSDKPDYIYDIVVKRLPEGKSALALYRDGELFMATYVSVGLPVVWTKYGKRSAKTKRGQFKMIKEDPYYYSHKYRSPMPYGVNFDEGGFWFHQGNVTGYPASHGCVRQPGIYSLALYSLVKDKKHVDVFIDNNLYKSEK